MKRILKRQEKYLKWVSELSNENLFEEYSDLCGGDDYDGCFTNEGYWQMGVLSEEIIKRLKDIGFLNKEYLTEK
jgi:hypothetical protein